MTSPLHLVVSGDLEIVLKTAHYDREKLKEHLDLGNTNWKDATPRDFDTWCQVRDVLKKELEAQLLIVGSGLLTVFEEMQDC